jgi:hypothetical protein
VSKCSIFSFYLLQTSFFGIAAPGLNQGRIFLLLSRDDLQLLY